MSKQLKWQQKAVDRAKSRNNTELIEDIIDIAAGDEPDGTLSFRGHYQLAAYRAELESRLEVIGFLPVKS